MHFVFTCRFFFFKIFQAFKTGTHFQLYRLLPLKFGSSGLLLKFPSNCIYSNLKSKSSLGFFSSKLCLKMRITVKTSSCHKTIYYNLVKVLLILIKKKLSIFFFISVFANFGHSCSLISLRLNSLVFLFIYNFLVILKQKTASDR